MAKKKRNREEEHENLDRWLVSYADFITLLFAFFVTMYAISRVDEKKFGSMVESMQKALGSVITVQMATRDPGAFQSNSVPLDINISPLLERKLQASEKQSFEKLAQEIQKKMEEISGKDAGKADANVNQIKYFIDKRGLVLRFSERFFFNSGEAAIRPEVMPLLNAVAKSLEKIPNQIRIEGHTDSVPINTPKFPSNWELSTARATTIVHYLLTHFEFDPDRLSAAGYGEFRPISTNKTADGRLQNRRVDMVILGGREMDAEPQGAPKKGPIESSQPFSPVARTQ